MKLIIFVIFLLTSNLVYAGCEDQPSNEVDWTNCNFVENLDLIGVGMANAKMSGVNLSLANLEKSQLNNSDLSTEITLPFSPTIRASSCEQYPGPDPKSKIV